MWFVLGMLLFAAWSATVAHASTLLFSTDCGASGDSLKCHLLELLNILYALAGVLGFILVVAIVLAIKSYRNNKKVDP